jgi:hypothetical protein
MMTDYVIDETFVGRALDPADGFLVNLRQTKSQASYAAPDGDDGSGVWKSGYLQLRGSRDIRDLYCNSPSQCGTVDVAKTWVANASIAYRGALVVRSVPRGSQWAISLSDQPVSRSTHAAWPTSMWERIARERELVAR